MLPQRLVFVREIGDTEVPYWTPASVDGVHLYLEPGESVLHVCSCTVSQLSPKGVQLCPKPAQLLPTAWELPSPTTVVITDRQCCDQTTPRGFKRTAIPDRLTGWYPLQQTYSRMKRHYRR